MLKNIILHHKMDSNKVDVFIEYWLKLLDLKSKLLI